MKLAQKHREPQHYALILCSSQQERVMCITTSVVHGMRYLGLPRIVGKIQYRL